MSLAAVIDENILCIHSGLGDNFKYISDLNKIKKPVKLNHKNLSNPVQKMIYDILWSDPVN